MSKKKDLTHNNNKDITATKTKREERESPGKMAGKAILNKFMRTSQVIIFCK
jgi:hypothetical protein